jgi:hypothetical protein
MDHVTMAYELLCRYFAAMDLHYGNDWPRLPPEPGHPAGQQPWPSLPPGFRAAAAGEILALLQADCEPRPDGPPAEIVAEVRSGRLLRAVTTSGFTR